MTLGVSQEPLLVGDKVGQGLPVDYAEFICVGGVACARLAYVLYLKAYFETSCHRAVVADW